MTLPVHLHFFNIIKLLEVGKSMKCKILHETSGRMRVRLLCSPMSLSDADTLEYWLRATDGVDTVKVYDRTRDAVVTYHGARETVTARFARRSDTPIAVASSASTVRQRSIRQA